MRDTARTLIHGALLCGALVACGSPQQPGPTSMPTTPGRLVAEPAAEPVLDQEAAQPAGVGGEPAGAVAARLGDPSLIEVDAAVRGVQPEFEACWQARPGDASYREGEIRLRLVISLDGSIGDIHIVADTVQRADVQQCLRRTMGQLRLSLTSDRPLLVDVPFRVVP